MRTITALSEILDVLRDIALASQDTYTIIYNGALPSNDSMCMTLGPGSEVDIGLDYRGDHELDIVCNAKHSNQTAVIDALTSVYMMLSRMQTFPKGDGWTIHRVDGYSSPRFLERDADQFTYGCSFNVLVTIE